MGLLWLGTMVAQVWVKGFQETIFHRLLCFNLFWHALDIIWVAIFTIVYLMGARLMSDTDLDADHAYGHETKATTPRASCPRSPRALGPQLSDRPGARGLLTVASFFIAATHLVWGPSIPVALIVLAIAQMGVHLVFFLHITTGPDNTNNVLALAFGILIVLLIVGGSIWIMDHLAGRTMAPPTMSQAMQMQP